MERAADTQSSPLHLKTDLFKLQSFDGNIIQKKNGQSCKCSNETDLSATTSNRFTVHQPCMHIHPGSINVLANTSDAELVLAMFPNETMQRCLVSYECLGKLISSGESH